MITGELNGQLYDFQVGSQSPVLWHMPAMHCSNYRKALCQMPQGAVANTRKAPNSSLPV